MASFISKIFKLLYENECALCKKASGGNLVCIECELDFIERKQNYSKYFETITIYSWAYYKGKIRDGIIELKKGKKELAKYFSIKLGNFWERIQNKILRNEYIVIPVPSHKNRIKERGYCQSTLLSKEFAKILQLNFSCNFVSRIKDTKHMNSLQNVNERYLNIKDAFEIIGPKPYEKNLLIIDDILTSGSTICELARTIHGVYPDLHLVGLTIASGDTYS